MNEFTQFRQSRVDKEGEIIPSKGRVLKKKVKYIPSEYLNLGIYLSVPLLVAVFVGPWLDNKFHTGNLFTLSLLVFGTMSVFYNLYKLYKKG